MLIEEKVYALLGADDAVTALAPAERIKPPGDWQNLARPYIIHFGLSPDVIPLHDAPDQKAALQAWRSYQISCFGDTYGDARTLGATVVAALSGQHDEVTFRWIGQTYIQEYDIRVHQVVLEFEVWEAL